MWAGVGDVGKGPLVVVLVLLNHFTSLFTNRSSVINIHTKITYICIWRLLDLSVSPPSFPPSLTLH